MLIEKCIVYSNALIIIATGSSSLYDVECIDVNFNAMDDFNSRV